MESYNITHKYYFSIACIQKTSKGYKILLVTSYESDSINITDIHFTISYSEMIVYYI